MLPQHAPRDVQVAQRVLLGKGQHERPAEVVDLEDVHDLGKGELRACEILNLSELEGRWVSHVAAQVDVLQLVRLFEEGVEQHLLALRGLNDV